MKPGLTPHQGGVQPPSQTASPRPLHLPTRLHLSPPGGPCSNCPVPKDISACKDPTHYLSSIMNAPLHEPFRSTLRQFSLLLSTEVAPTSTLITGTLFLELRGQTEPGFDSPLAPKV